jgi:hypothetical protein
VKFVHLAKEEKEKEDIEERVVVVVCSGAPLQAMHYYIRFECFVFMYIYILERNK